MVASLKLNLLGKKHTLKLDIDPKSHYADWRSAEILDKGRVSKYNKKFSNLRKKIIYA